MIVTKKKPIEEVKAAIKGYKKIITLGCSECAAICQTGGSEQVKEMVDILKSDWEVLASISIDSPCDQRLAKRGLRLIKHELEEADAILSLSCGSGVQAVAEVTGKPVISALDTVFLGMTERLGKFYERCSYCGECILNTTMGICPVTNCPKSLRNGPCEGERDGKCEIEEVGDCVWAKIISRKRSLGEKSLSCYHPPKAWSNFSKPQKWIWKEEKKQS
jgi:ferredoxin